MTLSQRTVLKMLAASSVVTACGGGSDPADARSRSRLRYRPGWSMKVL